MFAYHRDLLSDEATVNAFRAAIHAIVRPGDVVIDVGTGTGILAFFACEAGAKHVYAIERQHSADAAALLARHVGLSDRITVLHALSRDVELPERADVLVTETMGPLVFNEGWAAIVADARERLLTPAARMIPTAADLWIAPVEIPELYAAELDWWDAPRYGFDLSPLRMMESNELRAADVPKEALLAAPRTAMSMTALTITNGVQSGRCTFELERSGTLHGFAIGFTATLAEGIVVTNAWSGARTWQQGLLFLERPIDLDRDAAVSIDLQIDPSGVWLWRGKAGDAAFEQCTAFARPPCILARREAAR